MTYSRTVLALAGLLGATSCAPIETAENSLLPFAGLSGTIWKLVAIESMDDTQGTVQPADPSKYTLAFAADGSLAARLDCNRGTGSWRNEISNATGGSLAIGPMAVTKALCPDPTLGETIERQLPYVRSFTISDGRLNMALMADGGTLVWEPAEQ